MKDVGNHIHAMKHQKDRVDVPESETKFLCDNCAKKWIIDYEEGEFTPINGHSACAEIRYEYCELCNTLMIRPLRNDCWERYITSYNNDVALISGELIPISYNTTPAPKVIHWEEERDTLPPPEIFLAEFLFLGIIGF